MNKIFADSEEKYVMNTVLYGKASDKYAYADAGCTVKIPAAEMLNALLKGALVCIANVYYMPVSFKEADGVVSVTVATSISTQTTTANTVAVLNSEEYTEE